MTSLELSVLIDNLQEKKRLCFQTEDVGGFDKIESLQHHHNTYISNSALDVIEKYLCEDKDDNSLPRPWAESVNMWRTKTSHTPY